MSVEACYQDLRSKIRNLERREALGVIWAYAQYLQHDDFGFPAGIEVDRKFFEVRRGMVAEWELDRLAREVIRHAGEASRNGASLKRWADFRAVVNDIKRLNEEIYGEFNKADQIFLEMNRILHLQLPWQIMRFSAENYLRYYKIFGHPPIASLFRQETGLELQQFLRIGLLFMGLLQTAPRAARNPAIEVRDLTRADIDIFVGLMARRSVSIAEKLKALHALDDAFAFAFSPLHEFPLVQISHGGKDELACPIPTLMFWRMTQGLYYFLVKNRDFANHYGASFQAYVGEVIADRTAGTGLSLLPEARYNTAAGGEDTVDWIVHSDDAAIFVECKTARLTVPSKQTLGDPATLERDLAKMVAAIVQLHKTYADYEAGRYPQLAFDPAKKVFFAIVTLEDWLVFGNDIPKRLRALTEAKFVELGMPVELLDQRPTTIMSVAELEWVAGIFGPVGIRTLMEEKTANYASWLMINACRERFPNQIAAVPPPFPGEFDRVFPMA
ncbi:hypothetical protein [Bosea sp. 2KB_26]|uniref:hypothetical protein n=1 Tax=Bosea sp. 2KB_26 TaxID=3237475 RepID=UPI003F8E52C9